VLPDALLAALERAAGDLTLDALADAWARLSARYRAGTPSRLPALDRAERLAYCLTRLPATLEVQTRVLGELAARCPDLAVRRVLDLGAGPGTLVWAAASCFPALAAATLVERDAGFVELGRELLGAAGPPGGLAVEWHTGDAGGVALEPHDLVVLSYVLGEVPALESSRLAERAWELAGAAVVAIEPGTPRGFGAILEAREQWLARGGRIVAPCPHEGRCPMTAPGWCHFAARVVRGRLHRRLKGGALAWEDEKFSYVAVARRAADVPSARILDRPDRHKGHAHLTLCTPGGLARETVSRRDRARWRAARRARWGDAWEAG
jgi:ribosomal protein RSM22 (predicted rRNA methylase)